MSSDNTRNYMSEICKNNREKNNNHIPSIRVEVIESPYTNGYTKQQLDMRRKCEILKYSSVHSSQTNNLTQKERFALLAKGSYNNNTNIISKKTAICKGKPTPTSSCDVPGPVMDIFCDNNVPLYNFTSNQYTRPYGVINEQDTTPYYIFDSSAVTYNTTNGLTNLNGNYKKCASIYFKNIFNQKYMTFHLMTPVALSINSLIIGNVEATHNIYISRVFVSVFFNDTIVVSNDPDIPNLYKLPQPEVDISSLKPIIMDVSSNGYIEMEKYVGIIKISNLVFFSATGYYYDIKLSFQVKIDTTSTNINSINKYDYFNINTITNFPLPFLNYTNCSLNPSTPNPGPFYDFYLSENKFVIPDIYNIIVLKPTYNSFDISFEYYDPHYIDIAAVNGGTIVNINRYYKPYTLPIVYSELNSDISYSFILTPHDESNNEGTVIYTETLYTLSNVTNITNNTFDSSSILINFDHTDLSYVTIITNNGIKRSYSTPLIKPIIYNGLEPGIGYTFTVTPYNSSNIAGNSLSSSIKYTLSSIYSISTSVVDSSSILINFLNSDLSYVTIQANKGNTDVIYSSRNYSKPITKPILYNELQTDASYTFMITPYNNENIMGLTVSSIHVDYTLSKVNNVTMTAYDSKSIYVDFDNSDLSYVKIQANIGNTNTEYFYKYYSTPFTKPILFFGLQPTLYPDSSYSFIVTPYNHGSVAGLSVSSNNIVYTLSSISDVTLTSRNSTSIDIDFIHSDLSYVIITANIGYTDTVYSIQPNIYSERNSLGFITPVVFNGLSIINSYRFAVTPYNHAGIAGQTVLSSDIAFPLNTVSNVLLTTFDSSSINVYFEISDFSYAIIHANIGGSDVISNTQICEKTKYPPPNILYNFNGLLPDVSYNFTIIPYNILNVVGISVTTENTEYTFSKISDIFLTNQTANSIDISFNRTDISYVTIQANIGNTSTKYGTQANIYYPPFSNFITFNGLATDVSYTFMITPYNKANVAGFSVTSSDYLYTLSSVKNIALLPYDSSSISVDFYSSDLSYVMIQANYGNSTVVGSIIKSSPLSKPIIYNGLIPDMCYNFVVTPYNHADPPVAGISITNQTPIYTMSYVNNFTMSVYDSSSISIDFYSSDLSYVMIQAKYGNSTVVGSIMKSSPLSKPIIYNGLLPDMCYNFVVTPYNHANPSVAGFSEANITSVYTMSYVNNITVLPYDSSSISIDFYSSDMSFVRIQAKYGNNVVVGNTIWSSPFTKPLIYNGLVPDKYYKFFVTPYNHANPTVAGFTITNILPVYTLSYVNNVTLSVNDSSSIRIDFDNSDMSYVSIQAKYGNYSVASNKIWSYPFSKPLIYNGLIPDVCYNFVVTPYNHAIPSVAGFSEANVTSVYTLSYINNINVLPYDSSSISINFNSSDLSYVMIQAKYGNSTVVGSIIRSSPLSKPILYNGLVPDMCYNFIVTPYNHAFPSVAGFTITNVKVIYTLAYVNNMTLNAYDTSSINIDFNSSDLSYVMIQARYGNSTVVGSIIRSSPLSKPILYNGLIPDMCYNFIVTPYNHDDPSVAGFTITNIKAIHTMAYVNNVTISVYDSSSINVNFNNSDLSFVKIQAIYGNSTVVGNIIRSSPLSKPILYNGLIPDMCYNFIVTPYNHDNIEGESVATVSSVYTMSYVNNITLSVYDSSSINVDFYSSDLSYVMIQARYGNSTVVGSIMKSSPLSKPILYNGLLPDMCYNFVVTPYNHADPAVVGFSITNINPIYTLSYINNVNMKAYDSSSISINFDSSDLSYVRIQASYGNSTVVGSIIKSSPLIKPIIYNGLIPDMCYNFIVTPYNHASPSVAGFSVTKINPVYTMSFVKNIITSVYDTSSISINFENSSLSYVTIQANNGITDTPFVSIDNQSIYTYYAPLIKPIIFNGLQPDASYTFLITPYNHENVAGFTVGNNTAVYTLSYINTINLSIEKLTTIMIYLSEYSDLSYVTISDSISNIPIIYSKQSIQETIIFNGGLYGSSYIFTVTPYNHSNTPGTSISSVTITL